MSNNFHETAVLKKIEGGLFKVRGEGEAGNIFILHVKPREIVPDLP